MNNEISKHHKTRSVLDVQFILALFESDDRQLLSDSIVKHPNHIIRMPNGDLNGYMGGHVPADWNGNIHQV